MSVSSAKTPSPPATEADLLALENEDRAFELIDGELVEKQAGFRHGRAQVKLAGQVGRFDRGGGGSEGPNGWWILTEQLVRMGRHLLRPDLSGWRREAMPSAPPEDEDGIIDVRPDWICEIITPKKAAHDLVRKKRIYHEHQVPHYWILDPRDDSLTVHRFSPAGFVQVLLAQRGERVRAEPFESMELSVGLLFGDEDPDHS